MRSSFSSPHPGGCGPISPGRSSRSDRSAILAAAPHAAIGFVEAHGLAFIIGIRLWPAAPDRAWHLTAAAVHALLGTSNLVFWQIFIAADMLAGGYLTTGLHGMFFALQLLAALVQILDALRVLIELIAAPAERRHWPRATGGAIDAGQVLLSRHRAQASTRWPLPQGSTS